MTTPDRAQVTRKDWEALPPRYRTGSPGDGTAHMLRATEGLGTVLVPVEVVGRDELFPLGQLVATPAALDAAETTGAAGLIDRFVNWHHRGWWGCLTSEGQAANDAALRTGARLLSAYRSGHAKWWVITEADRSATTVLLPSDY